MDIDRIQYLTKKAQHGVITPSERDELARLLGYDPRDYQGDLGLAFLIGAALGAIAAAIIIELLSGR